MRAAFALLALLVSFGVAAGPQYQGLVISDQKGGASKTTFKTDTPKIYLHANLADVKSGSMLKGDWIAVKTKVAPPNYRIDGTELKVGPLMNQVDFNMSKPNAGWPVGDYRIDLFIDGKPAGNMKFKIE
jgi:hypothetical protein